MWTLDQLEPEIDDIRRRIQQHRRELKEYFVARDRQVDLAILCAITREPLLLVGPPGTAKSDLVVKFTQSLGLGESDYFEYMLTKFTEPSEILGPIDISLLKEGRYVRRTKGMLPECRVAFLDEIFKSNSAILNSLLHVINERKFTNGSQVIEVPLMTIFGPLLCSRRISSASSSRTRRWPAAVMNARFWVPACDGISSSAHQAPLQIGRATSPPSNSIQTPSPTSGIATKPWPWPAKGTEGIAHGESLSA